MPIKTGKDTEGCYESGASKDISIIIHVVMPNRGMLL